MSLNENHIVYLGVCESASLLFCTDLCGTTVTHEIAKLLKATQIKSIKKILSVSGFV